MTTVWHFFSTQWPLWATGRRPASDLETAPSNVGHFRGTVWLSLKQQDKLAILQVRDNGIGLAADQRLTSFKLFVQVDNSTARSKGGLGVGLPLVKRLVEMHKGRVEAQSDGIGKGSTFTVDLPTLTAAEPMAESTPQAIASAKAGRILVVDDNPMRGLPWPCC